MKSIWASFILCLGLTLQAQAEKITNVRYLKPDMQFSPPVHLHIRSGKISHIEAIETGSEATHYVIPSFCDAYVTLGANSLGGQNSSADIRTALKSFLHFGFTHILSVADGKWITKWQRLVARNRIKGPDILLSGRPLLAKDRKTASLPAELYFIADTQTRFLQEIKQQLSGSRDYLQIFYRYHTGEPMPFTPFSLRQLRLAIEQNSHKKIFISTYADEAAILHALAAGYRYFYHPIPITLDNEIPPIVKKQLHWAPMFSVYAHLKIQGQSEKVETLRKNMTAHSQYFTRTYGKTMQNTGQLRVLPAEQTEHAEEEFTSYEKFLAKNDSLVNNMYLASGSGNLYVFPGIGGIQEFLYILQTTRANKTQVWKIPNRNTCSILGVSSGQIEPGADANLLLLAQNPMENPETLYSIERVYKRGIIMYKQTKSRRKNGRK